MVITHTIYKFSRAIVSSFELGLLGHCFVLGCSNLLLLNWNINICTILLFYKHHMLIYIYIYFNFLSF